MKKVIYMNLSGIYSREQSETQAAGKKGFFSREMLDLSDIAGTRGYCSEEAADEIRRRSSDYSPAGIHLLDSGNYHYLTKFWLEKIREPFTLIVFDHHTDMQRSAFGDILSCGSWIYDVIVTNRMLEKVILIGADKSFLEGIDPACEGRYIWIPESGSDTGEKVSAVLKKIGTSAIPVYISIDKDVLSREELSTDWDQGTMGVPEMLEILKKIAEDRRIIGADICGEPAADAAEEAMEKSERINCKLIECLSEKTGKR